MTAPSPRSTPNIATRGGTHLTPMVHRESEPMTRLGSSMTSTRCFGVMMIDKLVFDEDVAAIDGMPAALLMTCPRIRD